MDKNLIEKAVNYYHKKVYKNNDKTLFWTKKVTLKGWIIKHIILWIPVSILLFILFSTFSLNTTLGDILNLTFRWDAIIITILSVVAELTIQSKHVFTEKEIDEMLVAYKKIKNEVGNDSSNKINELSSNTIKNPNNFVRIIIIAIFIIICLIGVIKISELYNQELLNQKQIEKESEINEYSNSCEAFRQEAITWSDKMSYISRSLIKEGDLDYEFDPDYHQAGLNFDRFIDKWHKCVSDYESKYKVDYKGIK
jgi:hypothetical protein